MYYDASFFAVFFFALVPHLLIVKSHHELVLSFFNTDQRILCRCWFILTPTNEFLLLIDRASNPPSHRTIDD